MANILRRNDIHVMVSDEEKELLNKKSEMSKSKSIGHFIRKSVLEVPIF